MTATENLVIRISGASVNYLSQALFRLGHALLSEQISKEDFLREQAKLEDFIGKQPWLPGLESGAGDESTRNEKGDQYDKHARTNRRGRGH